MRFQTQVRRDAFEHIEADDYMIEPGGVLSYYKGGRKILSMAPGEWLTVHDEQEAVVRARPRPAPLQQGD